MKKLLCLVLCLAAVCALCASCSGGGKLHIRVFVPSSETGQSGTLYDGDHSFSGSVITVDAILNALSEDGKFTYSYDGEFIVINGLDIYENTAMRYMRGWVITVNGEVAEDGAMTRVRDGDELEVVYEFMDMDFDTYEDASAPSDEEESSSAGLEEL